MNSPLVGKYVAALLMSYGARDAENFDFEESLHDQLNGLWLQMSDDEHEECDSAARAATANYLMTSRHISNNFKLTFVDDAPGGCIKGNENLSTMVFIVHDVVQDLFQERGVREKMKINPLRVRDDFAKGTESATKWWKSGTKASLFREQGQVYA